MRRALVPGRHRRQAARHAGAGGAAGKHDAANAAVIADDHLWFRNKSDCPEIQWNMW